ncbi:MAG: DUF4432 family protein [Chloroflexi bacterium]|nr:DUF4432 family protein [Chloroflexota bacterium]
MQTKIHLTSEQFTSSEVVLAEHGELTASTFRYPGGVCALRLKNSLGELVMLPYQGQQIWDATLRGRRLTMKSMFDQPYPTRDFLSTYGGFLLHCGATAMGSPSAEDNHPLHGELPNAPYQSAALVFGSDEKGEYIGLTGVYRHTVAFNYNYTATPLVKLYEDSSVFTVSMTIHNLKASPMPLMFLEHVNFHPVDGGRLAQTVICDPENMRVRANIPPFMEVAPGYREFVKVLQEHPEKHLVFDPALVYDPEMVLYLNYLADKNGWAHTMQIHLDGSADLLRHRPEQLDHGVRWICRTADQDALGMEPCTAEVEGFSTEKKKGNVRSLPGGSKFTSELEVGVLTPDEVQREETLIKQILDTTK